MSKIADEILEERRRLRREGDPRLSPEGRAILRELTVGPLKEEFKRSLMEVTANDPFFAEPSDAEFDD